MEDAITLVTDPISIAGFVLMLIAFGVLIGAPIGYYTALTDRVRKMRTLNRVLNKHR